MISYIKGILAEQSQEGIIVETNGIGYFIRVPSATAGTLPLCGSEVKIHTYLHVKEDLVQLYGFWTKDDLEMFELMLRVNGIGPKGALGILSGMNAKDLRFAILAADAKTIAKNAPGVGLKTAQKMILELKDKVQLEETFEAALSKPEEKKSSNHAKSEAVLALTALGYTNAQALHAVAAVENGSTMTVEQLLKAALKHM